MEHAFKAAVAAGCKEIEKPHDTFWGDRTARVQDPFGYLWECATRVA